MENAEKPKKSANLKYLDIMETELEFVEMLKKKFHYPAAAVRTDVPSKFNRFDVLIQKGGSYIQAFEIKSSMPTREKEQKKILEHLASSLNEFSVDTPIYLAIKDKKEWKIYAYDDLQTPLDLKEILNYQDASRRFWGFIKDSVNEIPKKFNLICWISAAVVGLYFAYCVCAQICGWVVPLDYQYLLLLCLVLALILSPFLLQMTGKIKKFKLGLMGWEFQN